MKSQFTHLLSMAISLLLMVTLFTPGNAQKKNNKKNKGAMISQPADTKSIDEDLFGSVQYRSIGPFRGGRSAAVAGVPGKPMEFIFGGTGGGVWKTSNGGQSWKNISDGYFGGSIGAVEISSYDPNVIYVGGGEVTVRGNVSYGYGMFKSVDGGKTWEEKGLKNSRHIPRIRVHPRDPDIVWVAVLGDLYKSSAERGIYKTTDGGNNWKKVLFANEDAGAVDLILDPNNPRILYASTWKIKRNPYGLYSGGEGSALWKSTDSGETWINISGNKGLPQGIWGISGVTVSPLNSERVWAIIENEKGGVYRSDDAGETWTLVNNERKLRQRAWYYSRIYADTEDEDMVYIMNVNYHRSKDGGKTYETFNAPHGDHHDLWIDPHNSKRMIIGDDGGGQVSFDAGETWSTYHNQPTAQFYRVTTDNQFPFRIYAAQQDNSTVRIASQTSGGSITADDWEPSAGCECGHIAIDPKDEEIVFGGCYGGVIQMKNHRTGESRAVNVYPDNPMGHGAEGMKYRFQWNFPIFFSPHDSKKLYTASNHLHVSYNQGQSWEIISPDLTRNEPTKLVSSGGPITKDNTSVEYYCTIFAAAESPRVKDLLWIGSDDGLVHVSRDGGKNWENITPAGIPEWTMINSLEPDPFNDGGCYIAATSYKNGDYQPYLYKTEDYGQTWTKIVKGIDNDHFTRVVRADPDKQGLLYTGTETGMYVSFDDGANWQTFQQNLPIVPVTDLAIKDKSLVVATQGRSLWLIDDLTVLHQLDTSLNDKELHVYKPDVSYRKRGFSFGGGGSTAAGTNKPNGVTVHYYLKEAPGKDDVISLTFADAGGKIIQTFSTDATEKKNKLEVKKGANTFTWDTRYPGADDFEGMILWAASLNGPKAVPGTYAATLNAFDESLTQEFEILKDPNSSGTQQDIQQQFDFLMEVSNKLSETHNTIKEIRAIRGQMNNYTSLLKGRDGMDEIMNQAKMIDSLITSVEEGLYQTQNQARQDPLNFPIRLNNKLGYLNSITQGNDFPPTDQAVTVKETLTTEIDAFLKDFAAIKEKQIPAFNELVKKLDITAIILEPGKKS